MVTQPATQDEEEDLEEEEVYSGKSNSLRLVPVVRKVNIEGWVSLSDNAREEILKSMHSVSFAIYNSLSTEEHKKTAQGVINGLLQK